MIATDSRAAPRSAGRSKQLSREQIVDAALALADREGIAPSMRRLAEELGVGTMTVYGYFSSKEELLDAVFARGADEVEVPPPRGPWKEQLRLLVREIYRVLRRHPGALRLRALGPMTGAGALRSTDAAMAIMEEAGFDRAEATRAWRLLFTYAFGYAAFTPAEVPESQRREWRAALASLSREEVPRVVDAASEFVDAVGGDELFDHGLGVILDGLEQRLESSA